jgi:hypothetical protein
MSNNDSPFMAGVASRRYGWRVLAAGVFLISIFCCCQTTDPLPAPAITTQPATQTKAVGQSVTFSVVARGSPAPAYQWRKDGVNIIGEASPSYTIASVALTDAGAYDVVVTNSQGSVTSNTATLMVTTGCPHAPPPQPFDQDDPEFRFISPNGGEVFHVGDQCTVKVMSRLFVPAAPLYIVIGPFELSPPSGILATSLPGDTAVATVIFTIPDSLTPRGGGQVSSVSDSCLIKIFDYSHPAEYLDYSDCYFRIIKP